MDPSTTSPTPIAMVEDLLELLELGVAHHLDTDPRNVVLSADSSTLTYHCQRADEGCGFSLRLVQRGDGLRFDVYSMGQHEHSDSDTGMSESGENAAEYTDTDDEVTIVDVVIRNKGEVEGDGSQGTLVHNPLETVGSGSPSDLACYACLLDTQEEKTD